MDWSYVIINAIVLACIYGTLAIGVSITWSSLGLINMSFGFIFSFAGYGAWLVAQHISQSGIVILASGTNSVAGADHSLPNRNKLRMTFTCPSFSSETVSGFAS